MPSHNEVTPPFNGSADFFPDVRPNQPPRAASETPSRGSDGAGGDFKPPLKVMEKWVEGHAACGCPRARQVMPRNQC
ncbi:hypothetical protein TWF281_007567 [Arthrobotrys megalospora]